MGMTKCGCGVGLGEQHKPCCQWEQCPFCGNQLFGCQCWQKPFGIIEDDKGDCRDMTEAEEIEWERIIKEKAILFGNETGHMRNRRLDE